MKRKGLRLFRILFFIMFVPLMVYLVGGELFLPDEWDRAQSQYEELDLDWKRVCSDGRSEEFQIPGGSFWKQEFLSLLFPIPVLCSGVSLTIQKFI